MISNSFIKRLKYSIIDFDQCDEMAKGKFLKAFFHLFIISVIAGLISFGSISIQIYNKLQTIPNFELSNGSLNVDQKSAFIYEQNNAGIIVVDTLNEVDENILLKYPQGIYINKDKFLIKSNNQDVTKIYRFSDDKTAFFNKTKFLQTLPWLILIILIVGIIVTLAENILYGFLLSFLGRIISVFLRFPLRLPYLIRLSFYIVTLPIIIKAIVVGVLQIKFEMFDLMFILLAGFYLYKTILFKKYKEAIDE